MANIDVKKVLDIGGVVVDALQKEADKSSNKMTDADVNKIAPAVEAKVEEKVKKEIQPIVDHLNNQEPWYQSRVAISAIVGILTAILGVWGYNLDAEAQSQLVIAIMAVSSAVTAILNVWARYIAKKPIGQ